MITNDANKVMDEYNMFLSVLPVSKQLLDEHFTVIWANDSFYELSGYSKEEYEALFHHHVDEHYHDDPVSITKMGKSIMEAYEHKESRCEFECRMPIKGGGFAWIQVTGRFTDEIYNGVPVMYTVYTDITRVKELQFELEGRSQRLHKALERAKQANRAKSDFLSHMSHDIRTPMNAIIGMTDIAMAHMDNPDKIQDCLKKISLSSHHLLGLINDVLDMSKIESNKMTLHNSSMFLPEVLENVVSIIQPDIKAKKQHFSVRLHQVKHEQFYCDALRLRQVFINILSNASKFTPAGGQIALDVEENNGDNPEFASFTFTFSDTGIGIKPEFMDFLFEAFTRDLDSRVDKIEGSGLGMAITKRIVDMMGGTIEVHSQPGLGSSFQVSLLLQIKETPQDEVLFPDLKVLVVDDDIMMCAYTLQMLRERGLQAEWVNHNPAAVEKIIETQQQGENYDAVLLNWKKPNLVSMQMLRLIRARVGEALPILIVSAYDWTDIEQETRAMGVKGFLPKPVFFSTLCQGLQQYVLEQQTGKCTPLCSRLYNFTGKRILLVEDNQLNREIVLEFLTSTGAMVEYACNGAQGVAKFEQSQEYFYDLILMDVQMPVLNGYKATKKIRQLPRKDSRMVPILAMTADVFTKDIAAAKEVGMNGHLAKPLDVLTMNQEISKFLS